MNPELDKKFMRLAINEAFKAKRINEVPVGAVLVNSDNTIISRAFNKRETTQDPISHAEVLAISEASRNLKNWRLLNTTLYVTLEPCVMCMGAIISARIKRVVIGSLDPKAGAILSNFRIGTDDTLNHKIDFTSGILEEECAQILSDFFKKLRN